MDQQSSKRQPKAQTDQKCLGYACSALSQIVSTDLCGVCRSTHASAVTGDTVRFQSRIITEHSQAGFTKVRSWQMQGSSFCRLGTGARARECQAG